MCSLSNKSHESAITTQSYTAYSNTKKWIKFSRIFFFSRKIIFAVFNFRESLDNSRKLNSRKHFMPHGIMFCDYIWSICRGKSQVSPKCCKKWEDIFLVASVYWFYINTSQVQMKKRKWKDFVFFPCSDPQCTCLVLSANRLRIGSKNVWLF